MKNTLKRIIDFSLSLTFLLIFLPIILFVCLLNKLFLGSPIFFTQKRIGYKEKSFKIIKFRSMKTITDSNGNLLSDEHRLSKYGHYLRKLSIDELPTLLNVIKGDMSLVGPRPLYPEYLNHYSEEQKKRHAVKPGITGWAQINGRNAISWEERLTLDVWYVNNQSLILDIEIFFRTFIKVLRTKDISHKDHVTMPRFDEVVKNDSK